MGQAAVSFLLCEITEQQNVSGSAPLLKTRLNKAEGDTHRREDSGKGKEGGAVDLEDFLGSVGIYSVLRIELAKCLTGAELQPCPVSTAASLQQGQNELSVKDYTFMPKYHVV
ncbi:Dihydroxy-acid dehydratase [Dissostichus eleginoides]|uniref:Dihydroxy-acid dehydratase n=1 Tax=Dissostichus eleginoides TaxID=100907 RepID=A0AAD9EMU0_DISEL|nr:Dihydroxy-acid dehydratase [Dissostichus eleginoides]